MCQDQKIQKLNSQLGRSMHSQIRIAPDPKMQTHYIKTPVHWVKMSQITKAPDLWIQKSKVYHNCTILFESDSLLLSTPGTPCFRKRGPYRCQVATCCPYFSVMALPCLCSNQGVEWLQLSQSRLYLGLSLTQFFVFRFFTHKNPQVPTGICIGG